MRISLLLCHEPHVFRVMYAWLLAHRNRAETVIQAITCWSDYVWNENLSCHKQNWTET